jgi:anti-sigma28 factor (negative regulator of flagellin synthesis)
MRIDSNQILRIHPAHESAQGSAESAARLTRNITFQSTSSSGVVAEQVKRYQQVLPREDVSAERVTTIRGKIASGELLTRDAAERTATAILSHGLER